MVFSDDDDSSPIIPPRPDQSPTYSLTNTDEDSLADSPSPQTPPTMLAPIAPSANAYHTRHHSRPQLRSIQVPTRSFADERFKSPDTMRWRFNESPSGSGPLSVSEIGRTLPHPSPLRSSPQGPPAPRPSGQRRRNSISAPVLHRILTYPPSSAMPALVWNVSDPPSTSSVLMTDPRDSRSLVPVPRSVLNEPATHPPQKEMQINCVGHSLWRPLVVTAGNSQNPRSSEERSGRTTPTPSNSLAPATPSSGYVTVIQVLREIYMYLHTRMRSNEYEALKSLPTEGFQTSVAKSFYQRCEAEGHMSPAGSALPGRGVNVRFQASHQGSASDLMKEPISPSSGQSGASLGAHPVPTDCLRRLDCLLGQTRFLGLSSVGDGSSAWYMNVGTSYR